MMDGMYLAESQSNEQSPLASSKRQTRVSNVESTPTRGHQNASADAVSGSAKKKLSKIVGGGLRQFSVIVSKKLESKGSTTYSEVADEIIAEYAATQASEESLDEFNEKNIRRRVYDALNVLMAVDIIERDKKEIRWKGLPSTCAKDLEEIKEHRVKLNISIEKKAAYLKELQEQFAGLQNLVFRNKQSVKKHNGPSEGFTLPFILVQTNAHATVEVEISEDMQLVHFDFNSTPFALHDDSYILKLLRRYQLPQIRHYSECSSAQSSDSSSCIASQGTKPFHSKSKINNCRVSDIHQ